MAHVFYLMTIDTSDPLSMIRKRDVTLHLEDKNLE